MANFYPSTDKSFQYVLFALMAVRTATVLTAVSKSHIVITCDLLFDQTGNDMTTRDNLCLLAMTEHEVLTPPCHALHLGKSSTVLRSLLQTADENLSRKIARHWTMGQGGKI